MNRLKLRSVVFQLCCSIMTCRANTICLFDVDGTLTQPRQVRWIERKDDCFHVPLLTYFGSCYFSYPTGREVFNFWSDQGFIPQCNLTTLHPTLYKILILHRLSKMVIVGTMIQRFLFHLPWEIAKNTGERHSTRSTSRSCSPISSIFY